MNRRLLVALLLAANVLVFAVGWYWRAGQHQNGPLYCFSAGGSVPGQVWALSPIPAPVVPECPTSPTYRQEIRRGLARTEQFRVEGWQPRALLGIFLRAGYTQQTDDLSSNDYAAFLLRGTERLQYNAVRQGGSTLITVSGPPLQ